MFSFRPLLLLNEWIQLDLAFVWVSIWILLYYLSFLSCFLHDACLSWTLFFAQTLGLIFITFSFSFWSMNFTNLDDLFQGILLSMHVGDTLFICSDYVLHMCSLPIRQICILLEIDGYFFYMNPSHQHRCESFNVPRHGSTNNSIRWSQQRCFMFSSHKFDVFVDTDIMIDYLKVWWVRHPESQLEIPHAYV